MQGAKGPQAGLLTLCLTRVGGTGSDSGREIADMQDEVRGEEDFSQPAQVQPFERSILEGPTIEVKTIDVEVGNQVYSLEKTETRRWRVSTLPPKREGG